MFRLSVLDKTDRTISTEPIFGNMAYCLESAWAKADRIVVEARP